MRVPFRIFVWSLLGNLCWTPAGLLPAEEGVWPGFRGTGDSHTKAALALRWSDTENIAWKLDLTGYGQSSPVVWKGRAFVTTTNGENKEKLIVTCLDTATGKVQWTKEFEASQKIKASDYVSRGAPTPLVDSKRVYAFFESGDLIALTHSGEKVWSRSLTKDYGEIEGNHGLGSSPAQSETAVFVLVDHAGPSYLAAFDKETGKTLWKQNREPRVSWSSPVVVPGAKGAEVILSSNGSAQSYSAEEGTLLWEIDGLDGNTVASPSVSNALVLVGSSKNGNSVLIRRGGNGTVTGANVAWRAESATSSFGSPLVEGNRAYFVSKAGVAYAVDLETGKTVWTQRLPDSTWASPLLAGNRVYFFCKNGETVVVGGQADEFDELARNTLTVADRIYGVAVAGDRLLIRTGSQLICVAPEAAKSEN